MGAPSLDLLNALLLKLKGEVAVHNANIHVYLENPVGIGEHPDIIAAIESETEKMAAAQEKIDVLERHFYIQE
tara:strand:+ start:153 stop:371 length:219 start_codon:yes stop_codon:yes gene_type:complete